MPSSSTHFIPPSEIERDDAQDLRDFDRVYETWFDFVHRSVRRLGVPDSGIDDAVQDVFVVVHRRLSEFEGRSTLKTWLFGIVLRVARDHRRTLRRKGGLAQLDETLADRRPGPLESAVQSEAVQLLDLFLESLDDDRRAVFVMVELEQWSVPEAAALLGVNVNTVYSRLRLAREDFNRAVARHQARER